MTVIHVANGLIEISREKTSFRCSNTGIWLDIIAVNHTRHHINANILYHDWNNQCILSSDMWLPDILIIATENRIAISVTVNPEVRITSRILITLDQVVWYNKGIAFILLSAKSVIPYTLKLWKNDVVGEYTLHHNIPELHMISQIPVNNIITIIESRLLSDFIEITPKYQIIKK